MDAAETLMIYGAGAGAWAGGLLIVAAMDRINLFYMASIDAIAAATATSFGCCCWGDA